MLKVSRDRRTRALLSESAGAADDAGSSDDDYDLWRRSRSRWCLYGKMSVLSADAAARIFISSDARHKYRLKWPLYHAAGAP